MTTALETNRLILRGFSPEDLIALLEGVRQGEAQMGVRFGDGLRDFYVSGEASDAWLARLRAETKSPWIHGFGVVEQDTHELIGLASFKGPPDEEGVVEIAYAIVPSRENRGYATEASAALVDFAFRDPRVRRVRAHTLPESNASTRVLSRNGFHHLGEVIDPEDGRVWRWERART